MVEAGGSIGLGSGLPKGKDTLEVDARWALPMAIAFSEDGVAATAQCSLQGLRKMADGTFRYLLKVHTVDLRKPCTDKDLEPSLAGNGSESPGSNPDNPRAG